MKRIILPLTLGLIATCGRISFGAISSSTSWEVNGTTGSDNGNGGGFDPTLGGTDYSYPQNLPRVTFDGSVITATTPANGSSVTITGYTVAAGDVGNVLHINGGTNYTTGFYLITVVNVAGKFWTLDRACVGASAGSAMTGGMGGPVGSPGIAAAQMVNGNTVWIKYTTYTITSASTNISSGCISMPGGATAASCKIIGYEVTRGDDGQKPYLKASGITNFSIILTPSLGNDYIENLWLDCNALATSRGINATAGSTAVFAYRVKCTNSASFPCLHLNGSSNNKALMCEVSGVSGSGVAALHGGSVFYSTSHDNTVSGVDSGGIEAGNSGCDLVGNISWNNPSSDCFIGLSGGGSLDFINNTAYGCQSGFKMAAFSGPIFFQNNIVVASSVVSGRFGFTVKSSALTDGIWLYNNAVYNYTLNIDTNAITNSHNIGMITLTANPFVSTTTLNFQPNNTVGGGAALKAAGIPGATSVNLFTGTATKDYLDIGAVQHPNPMTTSFGAN